MKILRKIMSTISGDMFTSSGDLIETKANTLVMDSLLIVIRNSPDGLTDEKIRYRMLQCGIFMRHQDLQAALKYMNKKGLLVTQQASPVKRP